MSSDEISMSEALLETAEFLVKLGNNLKIRSEKLKERKIEKDKLKNTRSVRKVADKLLLICELTKKSIDNVEVRVKKVQDVCTENSVPSNYKSHVVKYQPKTVTKPKENKFKIRRVGAQYLKIPRKVPLKHYVSCKVYARSMPRSMIADYPVYYNCKLFRQKKRSLRSPGKDKKIDDSKTFIQERVQEENVHDLKGSPEKNSKTDDSDGSLIISKPKSKKRLSNRSISDSEESDHKEVSIINDSTGNKSINDSTEANNTEIIKSSVNVQSALVTNQNTDANSKTENNSQSIENPIISEFGNDSSNKNTQKTGDDYKITKAASDDDEKKNLNNTQLETVISCLQSNNPCPKKNLVKSDSDSEKKPDEICEKLDKNLAKKVNDILSDSGLKLKDDSLGNVPQKLANEEDENQTEESPTKSNKHKESRTGSRKKFRSSNRYDEDQRAKKSKKSHNESEQSENDTCKDNNSITQGNDNLLKKKKKKILTVESDKSDQSEPEKRDDSEAEPIDQSNLQIEVDKQTRKSPEISKGKSASKSDKCDQSDIENDSAKKNIAKSKQLHKNRNSSDKSTKSGQSEVESDNDNNSHKLGRTSKKIHSEEPSDIPDKSENSESESESNRNTKKVGKLKKSSKGQIVKKYKSVIYSNEGSNGHSSDRSNKSDHFDNNTKTKGLDKKSVKSQKETRKDHKEISVSGKKSNSHYSDAVVSPIDKPLSESKNSKETDLKSNVTQDENLLTGMGQNLNSDSTDKKITNDTNVDQNMPNNGEELDKSTDNKSSKDEEPAKAEEKKEEDDAVTNRPMIKLVSMSKLLNPDAPKFLQDFHEFPSLLTPRSSTPVKIVHCDEESKTIDDKSKKVASKKIADVEKSSRKYIDKRKLIKRKKISESSDSDCIKRPKHKNRKCSEKRKKVAHDSSDSEQDDRNNKKQQKSKRRQRRLSTDTSDSGFELETMKKAVADFKPKKFSIKVYKLLKFNKKFLNKYKLNIIIHDGLTIAKLSSIESADIKQTLLNDSLETTPVKDKKKASPHKLKRKNMMESMHAKRMLLTYSSSSDTDDEKLRGALKDIKSDLLKGVDSDEKDDSKADTKEEDKSKAPVSKEERKQGLLVTSSSSISDDDIDKTLDILEKDLEKTLKEDGTPRPDSGDEMSKAPEAKDPEEQSSEKVGRVSKIILIDSE